jgi:hypothetical protein
MRRALVLALACATPAGASRVNVSRLERQAFYCALWVRARSGLGSRFNYALRPNRDGTVTLESSELPGSGESAAFRRCLREEGNDVQRAPEPSRAQEEAAWRRRCSWIRSPIDMEWKDCYPTPAEDAAARRVRCRMPDLDEQEAAANHCPAP